MLQRHYFTVVIRNSLSAELRGVHRGGGGDGRGAAAAGGRGRLRPPRPPLRHGDIIMKQIGIVVF